MIPRGALRTSRALELGHWRPLPALVIVCVLAVPSISLVLSALRVSAAYTPHSPIGIGGDTGFTAANGVTGGSGTASDPYIIAGWEINASPSFYAIAIANTRAPFVIRQ